jgi:GTP cyclohydrolase IB
MEPPVLNSKAKMIPENAVRIEPRPAKPPLPDVARDTIAVVPGAIDKVGMSRVETAIRVRDVFGRSMILPAFADVSVSLDDPDAKGIHMSRLFLGLQQSLTQEDFSFGQIDRILRSLVQSQQETSRSSFLRLSFDYLAERRSLLSENVGWRRYPVSITGSHVDGRTKLSMEVQIAYSSTCPCSAALARQVIQEKFREKYQHRNDLNFDDVHRWLGMEDAVCATPHSQRSTADVAIQFEKPTDAQPILSIVDALENAVGTSVQTAVKRDDEQEFSRLNGRNLMFVEDAARRLRATVEGMMNIADFRIAVRHMESLHPHDAVAVSVKGVPEGYQA